MNKHQETVLANNILEFLIDPTKFPVERRIYQRPEEILKNESYEKAKADAVETYGDQKKNSDFYTSKNSLREASIMDRRTFIASADILAQHFHDENDAIATDLRTIAYCVSKMSDEEYASRMATSVEAKGKAETVACPECGTKVLKQTGYCLKCKEKTIKKEASIELWSKEAALAVQEAILSDVMGSDVAIEPVKEEVKEEPKKEEVKEAKEEAKEETPVVEEKTDVEAKASDPEEKVEEAVIEAKKEKVEDACAPEKKALVNTDILAYDTLEIEAGMQDAGELTADEQTRLNSLFM